jgi:HEAT repeat protein
VALGWFGARYTPKRFGGVAAGLGGPMFSSVRNVEPDEQGRIQIMVDQVRREVVHGRPGDPRIDELLSEALRDESNPDVRAQSIGVLENQADSGKVRQTLIQAALHDTNAGVRLRAVDGLKPYAGDGDVRSALVRILLNDDNAGVRMQAVDLLSAHTDDSIIGPLQDAIEQEQDSYIRMRCRNLLKAMKASVGIY